MKFIRGMRPLVVTTDFVLWAKGYSIYVSDPGAFDFDWICNIPISKTLVNLSHFRTLQRLARLEVFIAAQLSDDEFILVTRGQVWLLNTKSRWIKHDHTLRVGSRPLSFLSLRGSDLYADGVYYGEYWGNPKRESVSICHRAVDGSWRSIYKFPAGAINHIHSLVENPGTGEIWILTGDFDGGSGFWLADHEFKSVRPLLVGKQEFRATWAKWYKEKLYYATDSQLMQNSFSVLSSEGSQWSNTRVTSTYGSSVYSASTTRWTAFSTTVEPASSSSKSLADQLDTKPGPGILGRNVYVYVWRHHDDVEVVLGIRKDWLPPGLFQFGAVIFPDYRVAESNWLYCYCVGVRGSFEGNTLMLPIEKIEN